jgi:hypothetical protein
MGAIREEEEESSKQADFQSKSREEFDQVWTSSVEKVTALLIFRPHSNQFKLKKLKTVSLGIAYFYF